MRFTTFDIEFADVLLPSICSISIIDWNDNIIENVYKTMINPDCDIDPFLQDRHKITNEQVQKAPTLPEVWKDIYDHLENRVVFSHYANRNVTSLKNLADINYLNMPPFIFCCSASISRKLWPYFKNDTLPEITERLAINDHHYDSYEDAKSVGYIIQKAMADTETSSLFDFFNQVGFSGGFIEDGEKHIYRAIKKDNGYIARIKENDIRELDWTKIACYSYTNDIISSCIS